jgi:hypothetical protein
MMCCARSAKGENQNLVEWAPPLLAADPVRSDKMLTISGTNRFIRRGNTCQLHAIS